MSVLRLLSSPLCPQDVRSDISRTCMTDTHLFAPCLDANRQGDVQSTFPTSLVGHQGRVGSHCDEWKACETSDISFPNLGFQSRIERHS